MSINNILSHRDFTETVIGIIVSAADSTLNLAIKTMGGIPRQYKDDHFKDASIIFERGGVPIGSAEYIESSKGYSVTIRGNFSLWTPQHGDSYKIYWDVTKFPAEYFYGDVINSCFEQPDPFTEIFPADSVMQFLKCNMNNCKLPAGCSVVLDGSDKSCHKQIILQNNLEMYEVGEDLQPIIVDGKPVPLNKKIFDLYNVPYDIPDEELAEPITVTYYNEAQGI